jgi:hypothetical protein
MDAASRAWARRNAVCAIIIYPSGAPQYSVQAVVQSCPFLDAPFWDLSSRDCVRVYRAVCTLFGTHMAGTRRPAPRSLGLPLSVLCALLAGVNAQVQTGNGYSSSTSSDAGNNVTTGTFIPVRCAALNSSECFAPQE